MAEIEQQNVGIAEENQRLLKHLRAQAGQEAPAVQVTAKGVDGPQRASPMMGYSPSSTPTVGMVPPGPTQQSQLGPIFAGPGGLIRPKALHPAQAVAETAPLLRVLQAESDARESSKRAFSQFQGFPAPHQQSERPGRVCSSCKSLQPATNFKSTQATCQPCLRRKKQKRDNGVQALDLVKAENQSLYGRIQNLKVSHQQVMSDNAVLWQQISALEKAGAVAVAAHAPAGAVSVRWEPAAAYAIKADSNGAPPILKAEGGSAEGDDAGPQTIASGCLMAPEFLEF